MKITLFLTDKIMEFFLPNQVSGSYSFDENQNEDYKLINVEAEDDEWVLYSKDYVKVVVNNVCEPKIALEPNNFYILQRDDIYYAIYTSLSYDSKQFIYGYNDNINLIIGNSPECNLVYECPFINGMAAQITKVNNCLKMAINLDTLSYKNDERINEKEIMIFPGDIINIYGLRIFILNSLLLINNPYNGIRINQISSGTYPFSYEPEKYENKEVKEQELYDKKSYFTKSPRIRRQVEEVEIKIDKPPNKGEADKMPLILTIGPMLTMAASSGLGLIQTFTRISNGETTWAKSWAQVVTSLLMMVSSLLWPLVTKYFNSHSEKAKKEKTAKLYTKYLEKKEAELKKELILQKNIWDENLLPTNECLKIINTRKNNFWCKRVEQSDFLSVRVGIGRVPLKVNVSWPEEGFTIEEDNLKEMADKVIEAYKYIENCPLEYSFSENFLTAIMGVEKKCYGFINNVLLQLMTFYCYDELKIVVFTNKAKEHKWEYLKYSNYCFTDDKSVRFFASSMDESKELGSYLVQELNYKLQMLQGKEGGLPPQKPHYLIICDNYPACKKIEFFKILTELDTQIGYSTIILENKLDKLPSKCINFINLNEGQSGILKNSYEKAEIINFHDEIDYNINMFKITKILSNIPVEIEGAISQLPDSIEFLEMERIGKVEQLNVLNRWNTNDSTKSLKAEIGVDKTENYIYLDLHEKFHGPHGLVAGTTGSGKSEFIITYILSMAINYSPDDIAFILIDYKGGGLAYAFENKLTGVKLPHLAGTITNLDKSEMHRTLVSIDSEVKRRQAEFNKARDLLGESTIDIYKYQGFYHEGKLKEPIPHLFLIADEFAELKSQQPDFMDNLISVARIGRSLGVHLILATQKPSGVVDDQIWSNTKFRVCLKVADASDSNEMIKKPDAALLKQSGRFYLQVGMDEIFELGQSGWAGAKYYPSDNIAKQVDHSVNFIDNNGQIIKRIQESSSTAQKEAKGEQLAAVMQEIIKVANQTNKSVKRLWLDNIPAIILVDDTDKKYNIVHKPYEITATIGEYDAPELQKQGVVTQNLLDDGNTIIYGNDGAERENLLNSIIYSVSKYHTSSEVNFYAIDYGSESLRMIMNIPHFGGIAFNGETEKLNNLIKLIKEEMKKRKDMFLEYGGDYKNYIKNSGKKLPIKVIILNNYDAILENNQDINDTMTEIVRDSSRYGIIYIFTCNATRSIVGKISDNCPKRYALKLKDLFEYTDALETKVNQTPPEIIGRGLYDSDGVHEFQTASIVGDESQLSKFLIEYTNYLKAQNQEPAPKIPVLPEVVTIEDVKESIKDISCFPLGIIKSNLEICTTNFIENNGRIVSSNRIGNTTDYIKNLIKVFKLINYTPVIIDGTKSLADIKPDNSNYFNEKFDEVIDKIIELVNSYKEESKPLNIAVFLFGISKILNKLESAGKVDELFTALKKYDELPIILIDEPTKLKDYTYENWYKTFASSEGVWIGTGLYDQSVLKTSSYDKALSGEYPNNMGFYISEGIPKLIKLIETDGENNEQ